MNVQVFYDSGRVDEFDVEHFTQSEPFDGRNMLTNFEVRFDDLESESLWLQAHFYDVRPEYRQDADPDVTPVARRMRGWRFLLVDKSEIGHVVKIVVNKEVVAWRQGPDLINGIKFQAQEQLCYSDDLSASVNKKAVEVHNYLANANPELADDEEALCQMFGFTKRAYLHALGYEAMQPIKEKPEKAPSKAGGHNEDRQPDSDSADAAIEDDADINDEMGEGEDDDWIGDALAGREEEQ